MTATLDPSAAPAAVATWMAALRPTIDAALDAALPVPPIDDGRLHEAMRYAVLGPGKRLRPALAIAACQAVGGTLTEALPVAVAVELLHAYTLVHDDLPALDDDDERRGRPTVHVVFGEPIAVLTGDALLTAAFGALAVLGPRASAACQVLAQRAGSRELLAGQAIDVGLAAQARRPTLDELSRMHAGKTGALFAAACELGVIAAGGSTAQRAIAAEYGMSFGIAFQHADDRDDAEYTEFASDGAEQMRVMAARALELATSLGPTASALQSVAAWVSERA